MNKINIVFFIVVLCSGLAYGQKGKKAADVAAIKQMCGCFEVKFEFGETFSPDTAYKFHENYTAGGLEWVELVEEGSNKLVLQHLLIVSDSMIIKHWRQDWLYENTRLLDFDHDNRWVTRTLPKNTVRGQWTQKVYQVDDSPRYEGTATWVHVDGKHFWESAADAPLPRREHTKRRDYNVMHRHNRHEITPEGWVHDQDNDKVLRTEKGDQLIAQEKGWNPYVRVADSRCQSAQNWWKQHRDFWSVVRKEWDQIIATHPNLVLHPKVDGKAAWIMLEGADKAEIGNILRKYVASTGTER